MSAFSLWGITFDQTVDNWLTSPFIAMPAGVNGMISWKVLPYSTDYPNDHYGVYVIGENEEPTLLFDETLTASITDFEQRTAAIPSSITGNFRIAFRHFDNPGDGYTYYYLNAGQTFGLYTSTGWQFWIGGVRRGWFSSEDSMLHVSNIVVENRLQLGADWEITTEGGLGLRWIGG